MRHHLFSDPKEVPQYSIALLLKASAFDKQEIQRNYVSVLENLGINGSEILALTLDTGKKSTPVAQVKSYLDNLLPILKEMQVKLLYVADSTYFKALTKVRKAEPHFGYLLPCSIKGYEDIRITLGVNYQQLIFDPAVSSKLQMGLQAIFSGWAGQYTDPGSEIVLGASYPSGEAEIREALLGLMEHPHLTADIEAFSLHHMRAGVGTIAFAWDEHHGLSFPVDYRPLEKPDEEGNHGEFVINPEVRILLREFFTHYKGKLKWHRATFDLKVLIYSLWMQHPEDMEGLLTGLHTMCHHFDDTLVIAYLATNSTAGNVLGLKALAQEFAGNWAQDDIVDIRKIPLEDLCEYNLVDCLCTWYVYKKYQPVMVQDQQEELYQTLMLPSVKLIIQIELTGMPMSKERIQGARKKLEEVIAAPLELIKNSPLIAQAEEILTEKEWDKDYQDRKKKAKNPDKIFPKPRETYPRVVFNPNSGQQLQVLLYSVLGLPVIDYTDTKLPATGADTLEKLLHHAQTSEAKELIEAFLTLVAVAKILGTFIPAFEAGVEKSVEGILWLHGSFNVGGTVSGRLSSSDPNLQNIPAGSVYGKLIKSLFVSFFGWIFAGADFNSLILATL